MRLQVKGKNVEVSRALRSYAGEKPGKQPTIVKTKHFAVKPMAPEEAVLQLELVGHDFFGFQNAESGPAATIRAVRA